MQVYLNGEYLNRDQAKISVLDRGFLFSDSVYEVIPVYNGHYFRGREHLRRLRVSLDALKIELNLSDAQWLSIFDKLLSQYGHECSTIPYSIYLQVSRGADKERDHLFPKIPVAPTVYVQITPLSSLSIERLIKGLTTITAPDIRWDCCYIKATSLLANVLQREKARQAGADEAILIKNGYAMEGTASNLFIVKNKMIITPATDGKILGGITRELILELADKKNICTEERPISVDELFSADEVWLSSSTKDVAPVIKIDEHPISQGIPGDIWRLMWESFQEYKKIYAE